jgi:hydrogenase maturation protein HypF
VAGIERLSDSVLGRVVRLRLGIRGVVQGIGFRPFVYRLATGLGLSGWVGNDRGGVVLEVEGPSDAVTSFRELLATESPPHSRIQAVDLMWIPPCGTRGFQIRPSTTEGGEEGGSFVVPDMATCPECLAEIRDPENRRYRYPFTNCTHCGPRYSILQALPYDRERTSMRAFRMCARCQAEYDNPADRRFHAQPNACPDCGPRMEYRLPSGETLATHEAALCSAVSALRAGQVVAVKGIGGFHLWVAAHDAAAVDRLRQRKHRRTKPFALMFSSMSKVREVCDVTLQEERLLESSEAPIVLVRRKRVGQELDCGERFPVESVAPGNPNLGVLLPYAPLHHLLLDELGFAVVATSGNRGDEPICTDEAEAMERLRGIADGFLVHDRPIVRSVDDSIVRVIDGRSMVLRRARGYAPLSIGLEGFLGGAMGGRDLSRDEVLTADEQGEEEGLRLGVRVGVRGEGRLLINNDLLTADEPGNPGGETPPSTAGGTPAATGVRLVGRCVLGVGAQMKSAVAVSEGAQVYVGQHLGNLETPQAQAGFRAAVADLGRLFDVRPSVVAVDGHPDYASTQLGRRMGLPVVEVQHHVAHVLACMAENGTPPPVLGVVWDGTGDGMDGTVWGGEFLRVTRSGIRRVARLRPFRLPGGEAAVREPRRTALAVLFEAWGPEVFRNSARLLAGGFSARELALLEPMIVRGVQSPMTSSAGRLFDAVASLLGLRQRSDFEGDAAMALEFAAEGDWGGTMYDFERVPWQGGGDEEGRFELDWTPMVRGMVADRDRGRSVAAMAVDFHETLAAMIVSVARDVGEPRVALSGGCFQNRRLAEAVLRRLREAAFRPLWHERIPPNDGGIALGQVVAVLAEQE